MLRLEYISNTLTMMRTNKLRTALSMLGIVIGIFSVIVMLAIGQGAQQGILERFTSMGANLITVTAGGASQGNVRAIASTSTDILDDDVVTFLGTLPGITDVSPSLSTRKQVIYDTYNTNAQVYGVLPVYAKLKNLTVTNGTFITPDNVTNADAVVVLGYQITIDMFGSGMDPIGQEIKLENKYLTVIGVLADSSQNNSRIFAPATTVQLRLAGTHYYNSIDVAVDKPENVTIQKTAITDELTTYFKVTDTSNPPFSVSTLQEMLTSITDVTNMMKALLAGISAISLLVGGIGVMNIMLVSVSERTREIGIRKAVGAMKQDILTQFLVESIILTFLAGAVGVAVSFGVVNLIKNMLTAIITRDSVLIACVSAIGIGIVFGILPAYKAATLKPIDALRYE